VTPPGAARRARTGWLTDAAGTVQAAVAVRGAPGIEQVTEGAEELAGRLGVPTGPDLRGGVTSGTPGATGAGGTRPVRGSA